MVRKFILTFLLTALLLPAISHGGIKDNRFNQRNRALSEKRVEKKTSPINGQQAYLGNQNWNGNKTFNKKSSSLLSQKAPVVVTESRQKKTFTTKQNQQFQDKSYKYRDNTGLFQKRSAMDEQVWHDNGDMNRRFTNNDVIYLEELDNFGRRKVSTETELSMQDFNRFAFRKNRSSEGGIDSERAGSEQPKTTVRSSSTVKE